MSGPGRRSGRRWGEKGRAPIARRTGNRFSVNAMSAINTKDQMHFMVVAGTFDSAGTCQFRPFLERLVGHVDHEIHLVVDGYSAHRSKKVKAGSITPRRSRHTSHPRRDRD
ncbi:transposase [Streptomyces sindenensis]|uniref:transposase n=1 Tax=Streptomyces sindenensis TaxID=67363 RepID=UPI001677E173|nr:transposase [Streptomyces sindenensis]